MLRFFQKYKNVIYWSVFILLIIIQFVLQYYGLIKYHYPVPPGDDCVNHFVLADKFLSGQEFIKTAISTNYPPFFHWLVAMLAKISHLGIVQILLYLTPLLPIGASIAIFLLTKQIFNKKAALLAMLIYALLAVSPYQLLSDGGYPNLLAAGIFIPLIIIFLSRAIKGEHRVWSWVVVIGMIVLTLLTHHLSSIYLILILILSLPFLIFLNSKSMSKSKMLLYGSIAMALIAVFIYILFETSLLNPIRQMIFNVVSFSGKYPFIHFIQTSEPNTILNFKAAALLIGLPISFFGLVGLLYFALKKSETSRGNAIVMVIVWSVILLLGSRFSFLSNPDRLVRDAAIPLVILAGGILELGWFQTKSLGWKLTSLIIFITLSIQPFSVRIMNSLNFNNMVRYTNEDKNAISKIVEKNHDPGPAILSLSCDDWLNYLVPGNKSLVDNKGDSQIDNRLQYFDYVYAEVNNTSWIPARCTAPDLDQLETNPNLEIEDNYQKNYSSVYIFKVRR